MKVNQKQAEILRLVTKVMKNWFEAKNINSEAIITFVNIQANRTENVFKGKEVDELKEVLTPLLEYVRKFNGEDDINESEYDDVSESNSNE